MSAPAGAVNGYLCRICRKLTVTVHLAEGVTPAFLACRATPDCRGEAVSQWYRPDPQRGEPTHEWYVPGRRELRRLSPAVRDHVERGGLLLREIQPGGVLDVAAQAIPPEKGERP